MENYSYQLILKPEQVKYVSAGFMFIALWLMRDAMIFKKENGNDDPNVTPLMLGTINCMAAHNSMLELIKKMNA